MSPSRVDGRRCMDADEMIASGMSLDQRGRWSILADKARIAEWAEAA